MDSRSVSFSTSLLVTTDNPSEDVALFTPAEAAAEITKIHLLATTNWHNPDWQGLQVVLAFLGAYFLHETNPFWLQIVGPPSTGKTDLGLSVVDQLGPFVHQMDDITSSALLSGYTKGKNKGKMNSLLHRVGETGILCSPDLTNLLSKDQRTVESVAGTMRQVYDGRATRNVGTGGAAVEWEGRISWIAALTPGYEALWNRYNHGGNRSLTVRWRGAGDPLLVSERVRGRQEWEAGQRYIKEQLAEMEKESPRGQIRAIVEKLIQELLSATIPKPRPPLGASLQQSGLYHLAQLVACCRAKPNRPDGKNISRVEDMEDPGRIQHQLFKVARGMAYLKRLEEPGIAEIALAYRVALDSIPFTRTAVLAPFPLDGRSVTVEQLLARTGYQTLDTLLWQLNDLRALGLIQAADHIDCAGALEWRETPYRLTDFFMALLGNSFPWGVGLGETFGDLGRIVSGGGGEGGSATVEINKQNNFQDFSQQKAIKPLDRLIC